MNSSEMLKLTSEFYDAMNTMRPFIGRSQLAVCADGARGEEKRWFMEKIIELAGVVSSMPKSYETDGQGDEAVVYLHYFYNDCDWYITEKDMEDEQLQAFGLARIWEEELGYISIVELLANGAELDFHWTPKAVGKCRRKAA